MVDQRISVPFNKPSLVGNEIKYIRDAVRRGQLAGDGTYTDRCCELLEEQIGAKSVMLTHSCTAALEMAAMLCDLGPGDEVIMPSVPSIFAIIFCFLIFFLKSSISVPQFIPC